MKIRGQLWIFCLALLLCGDYAQARQWREYHQDYLAVCRIDDSRICSASNYILGNDPAQDYAYRLSLSRTGLDGKWQISFSAATDWADERRPMTVQVDEHPAVRLAPRIGYFHTQQINDYRILDLDTTTRLLAQMNKGREVRISYAATDGTQKHILFSLRGLKNAIGFIDEIQREMNGR